MSDYIQKLSQIKKDIGVIQDSLFFEMHNFEKELTTLKAQLAKIEEQLKEANEVIELYAKPENWDYVDSIKEGYDIPENPSTSLHGDFSSNDEDDYELLLNQNILNRPAYVCGKRARAYLSKYKETKEGKV